MSQKNLGVRETSRGPLGACLVDGDPGQLARARRSRSKALALSLAIQASALAALLVLPLLATGEKLSYTILTPALPYRGVPHPQGHERPSPPVNPRQQSERRFNVFQAPNHIPDRPPSENSEPPTLIGGGAQATSDGPGLGLKDGIGNTDDSRPAPPTPSEPVEKTPRVVQMSHVDPAMLIRRVEPAYPVLARAAHREGRVELRAIISTDGSIRSLEVISGDMLFVQASYDAVLQWRYRPLILNGQAVEVETRITVIFALQH